MTSDQPMPDGLIEKLDRAHALIESDWDLLLRFSERTAFHRIARITTEIHIRMAPSTQ